MPVDGVKILANSQQNGVTAHVAQIDADLHIQLHFPTPIYWQQTMIQTGSGIVLHIPIQSMRPNTHTELQQALQKVIAQGRPADVALNHYASPLQQVYKAAYRLVIAGQLDQAIHYLAHVGDAVYADAQACGLLMTLHMLQGQYVQASTVAMRALKAYPENRDLHRLRVYLSFAVGDYQAVLDSAQTPLLPVAEYPEYYGMIAYAAYQLQHVPQAAALYQTLTMVEPHTPDWQRGLAMTSSPCGERHTAQTTGTPVPFCMV